MVLIVKENRTYDEVLGDETERRQRTAHGRAGCWRGSAAAAMRTASRQRLSLQGCRRHAQPSRHRRTVDLQRQFLRRFGRQRGRPPLAGRGVPRRLDGEFADGGLQRAEEGFPVGRPRPGGWNLPGSDSSVHPKINWKAALSGTTSRSHGVSFPQFRRRIRAGRRGRRQGSGAHRRALPHQRAHAGAALRQHIARVSRVQYEHSGPVPRVAVHSARSKRST